MKDTFKIVFNVGICNYFRVVSSLSDGLTTYCIPMLPSCDWEENMA